MDRPFVLGIECSNPGADRDKTPSAVVALARRGADGELELVARSPMRHESRGSDALVATIDELVRESGAAPSRIGRIAVSTGPGGYTALRVSVTAAKVIARTLGCEIVPVETYRVAAHALDEAQRPALITLASKKGRAFGAIAHKDGAVEALGIIDHTRVAALAPRVVIGDGHLPGAFREAAQALGAAVIEPDLDPWTLIRVAESIGPVAAHDVSVEYAREPDAVTQWRERHGG